MVWERRKSKDGGNVAFGMNAVDQRDQEQLTVGTIVRYAAAADEEGLRATTVKLIDKPGVRRQHTDVAP